MTLFAVVDSKYRRAKIAPYLVLHPAKILLFLFINFFFLLQCFGQAKVAAAEQAPVKLSELTSLAREEVFQQALSDIASLGRRTENSEAEKKFMRTARAMGRTYGDAVRSYTFDDSSNSHSFSSVLQIDVKGNLPDTLVIFVPVDQHFDGPLDEGNAGLALALATLQTMKTYTEAAYSLPISVTFVFASAERSRFVREDSMRGLGSSLWQELNQLGARKIAVLYLSIDEVPKALALVNGSAGSNLGGIARGRLAPYWYYERFSKALKAASFPYHFDANNSQLLRMGYSDGKKPLDFFLANDIACLELRNYPFKGSYTNVFASFMASISNFLENSPTGFATTWDRSYLSFTIDALGQSMLWLLPERQYIIFFIIFIMGITTILLITSIIYHHRRAYIINAIPRAILQTSIIYLTILATLGLGQFLRYLENIDVTQWSFWNFNPSHFLLARISSTALLFVSIIILLIDRRVLTRNPRFYELMSLALFALNSFIFFLFAPSMSFYFISSCALVFLSYLTKKLWLSLVSIFIIVSLLFILGYSVSRDPIDALYTQIFSPTFFATLVLSISILPFLIFAMSPLNVILPKIGYWHKLLVIIFVLAAIIIEFVNYRAVTNEYRRVSDKVLINEQFEQATQKLTMSLSNIDAGTEFEYNSQQFSAAQNLPTKRFDFHTELKKKFYTVTTRERDFLGRRSTSINFDFQELPYSVDLYITNDRAMTIYDVNFPYSLSLDGKTLTIYIGVNPPPKFSVQITSPKDFRAQVQISAHYNQAQARYNFKKPQDSILLDSQVDEIFTIGPSAAKS